MLSIFLPFFTFYALRPSTMCSLTPNPPIPLAYDVWRQITSTTGQLWEVHLRNDLPYYHTARNGLHGLTDTIHGFQMAISIR